MDQDKVILDNRREKGFLCARLELFLELLALLKLSDVFQFIQEGLADQKELSFYQQGEFIDLCRGPHVPSPKRIGAFKLLWVFPGIGSG